MRKPRFEPSKRIVRFVNDEKRIHSLSNMDEKREQERDPVADFLRRLLRVPKSEIDKLDADRPKRKKTKKTA